eukprot:COSAG02_NODE_5337_length_4424_cov_4.315376_6_plen_133_part_00
MYHPACSGGASTHRRPSLARLGKESAAKIEQQLAPAPEPVAAPLPQAEEADPPCFAGAQLEQLKRQLVDAQARKKAMASQVSRASESKSREDAGGGESMTPRGTASNGAGAVGGGDLVRCAAESSTGDMEHR